MDDSEPQFIDDLENALKNIDVFCKALVEKLVEDEDKAEKNITFESIEKLLRKKDGTEEAFESDPLEKHLIPLPHLDEPLIDILEDDKHIKILMQCRCKDQKVTIHKDVDGVEICAKECRKLNLPVTSSQIENMSSKCNNNQVLEVDIPKTSESQ
jgi:HSP20 family molecular chaperone IbpA